MAEYGFFKQVEIKDAAFKYGFTHLGIFALEKIKKGERVFACGPKCCYLKAHEVHKAKTRAEVEELFKKYPDCEDFLKRYNYTADDDLYDFPRNFQIQELTEGCMYFNHGCDANCTFNEHDIRHIIAKRDIEIGEELTYDYQLMETEASFYNGIECKCGSHKCRGILKFDYYRNTDWIKENYKYCETAVRKRIDELQTKWFSSSCHLKHYNFNTELGLTALKFIAKNELVAIYSDSTNISEKSHYLRHNDNPTCYVNSNGEVYAKENIEPKTELTLDLSRF